MTLRARVAEELRQERERDLHEVGVYQAYAAHCGMVGARPWSFERFCDSLHRDARRVVLP